MRIDQYLPVLAPNDAIGNHVLQARRVLREAGIESDIYAEEVSAQLRDEAMPALPVPAPSSERVVLYHASTHSDLAGWLVDQAASGRQRTLVYYHNITPPEYFRGWLPAGEKSVTTARAELAALAPHVELAVAASRFSEAELVALGFAATATCPLLVDLERYHDRPDKEALARLASRKAAGGSDWLFVGRMAPNKCQHDVVAAFALYRRAFDPLARLTLVGGGTAPDYRRAVTSLACELDVSGAVSVADGVSDAKLLAYYLSADVFVCLSEHEGFCVPLLEAMELGVPVVAYAAAAVPETLGEAGVLLADKDPLEVACTVADILSDSRRREGLVATGRQRAHELSLERSSRRLVELLGLAPRHGVPGR